MWISAPCGPGSGAPRQGNSTCRRSSSARSSSRGSPCSWRRRSGWARRSTSSEYARPRARRTLKPILETLAGIPSVVIGFFALTLDQSRPSCRAVRRDEHVHDDGRGDRRGDPRRSRSSRRWPRTRCTRCRAPSVRRPTGSAHAGGPYDSAWFPGRDLRDRGGADPRRLPGARRDDGGRDRRGSHREREPHAGPSRAEPNDHSGDRVARDRVGSGEDDWIRPERLRGALPRRA